MTVSVECRHNLYMNTTTCPQHFTNDMERLTTALAPYLVEVDGQQMVRPDAPEALARPYMGLVRMGYAKGWL